MNPAVCTSVNIGADVTIDGMSGEVTASGEARPTAQLVSMNDGRRTDIVISGEVPGVSFVPGQSYRLEVSPAATGGATTSAASSTAVAPPAPAPAATPIVEAATGAEAPPAAPGAAPGAPPAESVAGDPGHGYSGPGDGPAAAYPTPTHPGDYSPPADQPVTQPPMVEAATGVEPPPPGPVAPAPSDPTQATPADASGTVPPGAEIADADPSPG